MTATNDAKQLANLIASAASDKLGENILALDVSGNLPLCDIFLLVSGRSERQVAAIADGIDEKLSEAGHRMLRNEGKSLARWILLDYSDVIVHVMHEEDRMHYALERIWNDAPVVKLAAVSA